MTGPAARPVEDESSRNLLIVGAGLIGTSIGLAATAAGRRVWLTDRDPQTARFAASLGAGDAVDGPPGDVGVVVVAVPPAAVAAACVAALRDYPRATTIHVCSVQTNPAREVEASGADLARFLGTHPVAGREVSGPSAADKDLFVDRPWALCPTPATSAHALETARTLALDCRAWPMVVDPADHDRILARLSHAPQVVASALAASLVELDATSAGLAGPGIRDTTRLADSPAQMWGEIAAANAAALAAALHEVADPLVALAGVLEAAVATGDAKAAANAVSELIRRGRAGRALLPGKHGRAAVPLATVHCVVPDSRGALARMLTDIAAAGINVEDMRVDHAPGQPVGTATLAVAPADGARLIAALREHGWSATAGSDEAL